MSNVKRINFSANVNALGIESGFGRQIPIDEFPVGQSVSLKRWFPLHYAQAMKHIDVTRSETELLIESGYKSGAIPLESGKRFNIGDIGLSYASCKLTIYVD